MQLPVPPTLTYRCADPNIKNGRPRKLTRCTRINYRCATDNTTKHTTPIQTAKKCNKKPDAQRVLNPEARLGLHPPSTPLLENKSNTRWRHRTIALERCSVLFPRPPRLSNSNRHLTPPRPRRLDQSSSRRTSRNNRSCWRLDQQQW